MAWETGPQSTYSIPEEQVTQEMPNQPPEHHDFSDMGVDEIYGWIGFTEDSETDQIIDRIRSFSEQEQENLLRSLAQSDRANTLPEVFSAFSSIPQQHIAEIFLDPGSPHDDMNLARSAAMRSIGVLLDNLSLFSELDATTADFLLHWSSGEEVFENRKAFPNLGDQELVGMALRHERLYAVNCRLGELHGLDPSVAHKLINYGHVSEILRHRDAFEGLTDEDIGAWCHENGSAMEDLLGHIRLLNGRLLEIAQAEIDKHNAQIQEMRLSGTTPEDRLLDTIFGADREKVELFCSTRPTDL